MTRRRVVRVLPLPKNVFVPGLLPLAACFLSGSVAGCVWAAGVSGNGTVLASYIQGYLSVVKSGEVVVPALLPSLWEVFRWPLFVALMGFTAVGAVGVPILFAVRGFLLSFAAASFVKILGGTGCILAVLLLGVSGAFTIPVFFVLGTHGFSVGRMLLLHLAGRGKRSCGKFCGGNILVRHGVCTAILLFCVFLERNIIPVMLSLLAGSLSF